MEWGTPILWGWFLLFSRSGGQETKETYPTKPGSPTPCKQVLRPCLHGRGTPVLWGWFLLFSRSGGQETKETYPTKPGSPTPCKQGLRPCLHGVGDPGLVGLVSFVFTLWGTQNQKRPTPLNRGPPLHVNRVLVSFTLVALQRRA